MDAQADVRGDHEGTDVQGSAVGVGDPVLVDFHQSLDGLDKVLNGDLGNAQTVGRILHSLRVAVGAEELNGVVSGAVGLHAFEDLLGIVEHHACGVQLKGSVGNDAGVVPAFAIGVVHQEHVVAEELTEAQLALIGGLCLGSGGFDDLDIQHNKLSLRIELKFDK